MTNTAMILQEFWSSFGIPAYVEQTVPDEAQMPYITYRLAEPDWDSETTIYARIWYRSTSFVSIADKVDEISHKIDSGLTIPFDGGMMVIFKDPIFVQYIPNENGDFNIKCAYLSTTVMIMGG